MNNNLKQYAKEKLKKLDPEWVKMFELKEKEKEQNIKNIEKQQQEQQKEIERQKKEEEKLAQEEKKREEDNATLNDIKKSIEELSVVVKELTDKQPDIINNVLKEELPAIDEEKIIAGIINGMPRPKAGRDGQDAVIDYEKIKNDVLKDMPIPKDGKDGKDGEVIETTKLVKEVITKIKELPEKERIDISHLKNSQQILGVMGKLNKLDMSDLRWHGAGLGKVTTDATLTGSGTPDDPLKAVGGSGMTIETPTGDVDGVNMTYTVLRVPKYIIVDGINYFEGQGYSIVGLIITTDLPPTGFIRSIS